MTSAVMVVVTTTECYISHYQSKHMLIMSLLSTRTTLHLYVDHLQLLQQSSVLQWWWSLAQREVLREAKLRPIMEPGSTEAALHSFVAHVVSGSPTKNQSK